MKKYILYIILISIITLFIILAVKEKTADSFYKLRGDFFQNSNRPEKALYWYNRVRNDNRNVNLLLNMAGCYSQLSDYTNLIKTYRIICSSTNDADLLETLVWLEKETGDFDSGIADVKKLISKKPDSWLYKQMLIAMMIDADMSNQLEKTVLDFENNAPESASNCFQIAEMWLQIDNVSNAVHNYERCVEKSASNDIWRFSLAFAQIENKQFARALTNLLALVAGNENNDTLFKTIGYVYNSLGNDDKAIEYYRRAIRLNQQNYNALNNLAYILLLQNKNIGEAYELAQSAVQLRQKSFTVDTLAYSYYKLGKYKTALRYLKKAEKLLKQEGGDPDPEMEYHIGIVQVKLGEIDEAVNKINAALSKNKNLEELLKKESFYHEIKSRIIIK